MVRLYRCPLPDNQKSHDEVNGQSYAVRETHEDFWILPLSASSQVEGIASPNGYGVLGLGHSGGVAGGVIDYPDEHATHSGPLPQGLVVRLKSEQYGSEVIALSLAPLEESLFEVPKSFREITPRAIEARPRSWGYQLAIGWLNFRAWLASLFEIG